MNLLLKFLLICVTLTSCQNKNKNDDVIVDSKDLYNQGLDLLKRAKYYEASEKFGDIYFQHPGGVLTPYAEIMEAYSLYRAKKYLDAIDVLDNFMIIHPSHTDMAYVIYLKGLCHYDQISDIHHDQNHTKQALGIFEALISKYPYTNYASDAKTKLQFIHDNLAAKEMYIGRYYQKMLNPSAAIGRFSNAVNQYHTTSYTPEALYRLVECFTSLSLHSEASKIADRLYANYKDNEWTERAHNILIKK